MSACTQVLKQLDSYSLHDVINMMEGVLNDNGYEYQTNGDSEYVVMGKKEDVRHAIINELPIPKIVIDTLFSFTQIGDRLYIRVLIKK